MTTHHSLTDSSGTVSQVNFKRLSALEHIKHYNALKHIKERVMSLTIHQPFHITRAEFLPETTRLEPKTKPKLIAHYYVARNPHENETSNPDDKETVFIIQQYTEPFQDHHASSTSSTLPSRQPFNYSFLHLGDNPEQEVSPLELCFEDHVVYMRHISNESRQERKGDAQLEARFLYETQQLALSLDAQDMTDPVIRHQVSEEQQMNLRLAVKPYESNNARDTYYDAEFTEPHSLEYGARQNVDACLKDTLTPYRLRKLRHYERAAIHNMKFRKPSQIVSREDLVTHHVRLQIPTHIGSPQQIRQQLANVVHDTSGFEQAIWDSWLDTQPKIIGLARFKRLLPVFLAYLEQQAPIHRVANHKLHTVAHTYENRLLSKQTHARTYGSFVIDARTDHWQPDTSSCEHMMTCDIPYLVSFRIESETYTPEGTFDETFDAGTQPIHSDANTHVLHFEAEPLFAGDKLNVAHHVSSEPLNYNRTIMQEVTSATTQEERDKFDKQLSQQFVRGVEKIRTLIFNQVDDLFNTYRHSDELEPNTPVVSKHELQREFAQLIYAQDDTLTEHCVVKVPQPHRLWEHIEQKTSQHIHVGQPAIQIYENLHRDVSLEPSYGQYMIVHRLNHHIVHAEPYTSHRQLQTEAKRLVQDSM